MTTHAEPHFRFSKLLRDGMRGEVFSPGAPLRIARAIDAESLKGRHEGRGRMTGGGAKKPALSSSLQSRTGRASRLGADGGAGRHTYDARQRAVVKLHYFSHGGGGAAALRAHARYVARDAAARTHGPELDAAEREGARETETPPAANIERGAERSVFYDALGDGVDGAARVADWARGDRRHFRLILSAENGAHLPELKSYTREVMARAETALGTRLDWVAVDHWDTDNPHTHIILRGRADGRDLVIPRDYVSHGFRNAARDVATERLGPRGRADERLALDRETRAHRPTRLDKMIEAQLDENGRVRLAKLEAPNQSPDLTNALKARAQELRRLGLATEVKRNVFEFAPGWQDGLKAMELHLDIRKALLQQRTQDLARSAAQDLSKSMRLPPGLDR